MSSGVAKVDDSETEEKDLDDWWSRQSLEDKKEIRSEVWRNL